MSARSKTTISIGVLVGCVLLVCAGVRPWSSGKSTLGPEPVCQGTALSVWVAELTKHRDFDLRPPDRAAKAVKTIGPAAVPFLIEWLPKPERPATKLDRLLSGVPLVGDLFADRSRQPEPPVRSDAVVAAFRVLGPDAHAALPRLARILGELPKRNYHAWRVACEAIPWIGPEALPVMLTAVTNLQGRKQRWELIERFGILQSNGVPAIPALIRWAGDEDPWVRLGAVSALGDIGQNADLVVPVLRAAASSDPNVLVRRNAAEALGSFGTRVIPDLLKALEDSDLSMRTGALRGLGKVVVESPDTILPLLEKHLHDDNSIIRRSAAYALGFSGSKTAYITLMGATNISEIGDIIYQISKTVDPEALK